MLRVAASHFVPLHLHQPPLRELRSFRHAQFFPLEAQGGGGNVLLCAWHRSRHTLARPVLFPVLIPGPEAPPEFLDFFHTDRGPFGGEAMKNRTLPATARANTYRSLAGGFESLLELPNTQRVGRPGIYTNARSALDPRRRPRFSQRSLDHTPAD